MNNHSFFLEQPLAETIWRKCTDTDQGRALGDAIHGQMQGKQELLAGLHLDHGMSARELLGHDLFHLVVDMGDRQRRPIAARVVEEPGVIDCIAHCFDVAEILRPCGLPRTDLRDCGPVMEDEIEDQTVEFAMIRI